VRGKSSQQMGGAFVKMVRQKKKVRKRKRRYLKETFLRKNQLPAGKGFPVCSKDRRKGGGPGIERILMEAAIPPREERGCCKRMGGGELAGGAIGELFKCRGKERRICKRVSPGRFSPKKAGHESYVL